MTFHCEVSGSEGKISYQWFHNDDVEPMYRSELSSKLTIKEVAKRHKGKYKCVVKNAFCEEQSQPAELIIGTVLVKMYSLVAINFQIDLNIEKTSK